MYTVHVWHCGRTYAGCKRFLCPVVPRIHLAFRDRVASHEWGQWSSVPMAGQELEAWG